MNFCPDCGGKLKNDRFCPTCGMDLFNYYARVNGDAPPEMTEKEKREHILADFEIADHEIVRYAGKGGRVIIPDGISAVRDNAFYRCCTISQVIFPDSVKRVGEKAFYGCKSLQALTLPSDLETIGDSAFYGCSLSGELLFPPTLREIGEGAFELCTGLTSVKIPASVSKIGHAAFASCTGLKKIFVSDRNKKYLSDEGILFDDETDVLLCYPAGKTDESYAVPGWVKTIGECAFYGNGYLKSITLPSSVVNVMPNAFLSCPELERIKVSFRNKQFVSDKGVLFTKDRSTLIYYPASKDDAVYAIPEGTRRTADNSFTYVKKLIEVILPTSFEELGTAAFFACNMLERIKVSVGNETFSDDDGILFDKSGTVLVRYPTARSKSYYEIPGRVREIGKIGFAGATKLTSIIVPESVKIVREHAFDNCDNLSYAYVPEKLIDFYGEIFPGNCVITKK